MSIVYCIKGGKGTKATDIPNLNTQFKPQFPHGDIQWLCDTCFTTVSTEAQCTLSYLLG